MRSKQAALRAFAITALSLALPVSSTRLYATTFNWTKPNGCGFFSCDFFDASHWSPNGGPPNTGDAAFIDMTGTTHLTQNTAGLANLTLEGSAAFRTSGHRLSVTESPGNLFLFGSGFNDSTSLRVDEGAGFEVIAGTVSLHQGAEISLQGGGVTATFRVLVSQSSLISGHGTIGLVGNEIGSSIALAGTIRPSGGDITLITPNSTHDLDGNVGGDEPGFLDLTSTGNLVVNGEQLEPFSGQLDIGNARSLTVDSLWEMDGELNFTTVAQNRLIGPSLSFLAGSNVRTNNSIGWIDGDATWFAGASVNLRQSSDELSLVGDFVVENGATFGGSGKLINRSSSTMLLEDGANVGVQLLNQGTMKLGDSFGHATIERFTQQVTGTLEIQLGGTSAGEFDALHVLGDAQLVGDLAVSLPIGFSLEGGQRFTIVEVDGNQIGEFDGLTEGALVGSFGEELFITYTGGDGNDVVLFTAGLPGDFDQDGDVDGTDFLVWQRNPTIGELSDWQSNYGSPDTLATTTAAVPEPVTILLLATLIIVFATTRISNF